MISLTIIHDPINFGIFPVDEITEFGHLVKFEQIDKQNQKITIEIDDTEFKSQNDLLVCVFELGSIYGFSMLDID